VSFAPGRTTIALLVAGGLVATGLAVRDDTPSGRVLLGVLALLLLGEAARSLLVRPVLAVNAAGLTVGRLGRRERVDWGQLVSVRGQTTRRFVTTSRTLELDLGDRLIVLPAYRLGASPEEVATAVEAARPG
jgi:hypothetical protein